MNRRRLYVCLGILAAAIALYAAVVIRNFHGPIGDNVESFLYEYLSYYVSKNLSFGPLPHLNLDNDQAFYPFGTNVGLQSFCVERDLLFTLLSRTLGGGPWLQLYYLAGLVIATYGTFALLRTDHGDVRATAAAIIANCLNFYAAQKYPYHFNIACVHWSTLGIVCDFVIVSRLVDRRRISLSLVLLRTLLVVLAFGLELGHVLGYALTSALATCVFVALFLLRVRFTDRGEASPLARFRRDAREELATHRARIAALVASIVVFGVLYGSLVLQIVRAARQFNFQGVPDGVWWSQPIRLLIPYFPWIHGSQQPLFERIWGDQAEKGIGSGGAGLFLLGLGVLGFVQAKGHRLRYAPLLATFVMYIVSRPGFDLVRWMPWFAFTRVFSRATVVYSTLLGLLALGVKFDRIASRWRPVVVGTLSVVGALELYTIGMIKMSHPVFTFDDAFYTQMKKIDALPGAAVLDFPFCLLGGNGDQAHLCPYPERLKSVYALQRFHHKKVIGQYLGRIHPSQVKPFVDEGWPKMWDPDDTDQDEARRQVRCLNEAEWTFFRDFYEKNDFAGIQLAVDALPPGCDEQFYLRFGRPMGEVSIPRAGRLDFIPRDPATFARLDKEGARKLRLSLDLGEAVEVIRARQSLSLDVKGLSALEHLGPSKEPTLVWRWALAPYTEFDFEVGRPRTLVIDARLETPMPRQSVTLLLDGVPFARWEEVTGDASVARSARAHLEPGKHVVRFEYARSNTGPTAFAPADDRPMTVQFMSLVLRTDPPQTPDFKE